jgi:filamentous hemagglutinin family protein
MANKRGLRAALLRVVTIPLTSGLLLHHTLLGLSHAQITLDGSLGPPKTLMGPNYVIGHDLGQIRGSNLFHSFGEFNVRTRESATFMGPDSIANVLSRVTGPNSSSIDGLLRSTISGANLFLLNPHGVIFGPNASLDVSGSFHASTGDFIRLADGGIFYADLARPTVLTVAPPASFGFLTANPGRISIQESALVVPVSKTLSLVGGDVQITGGALGILQAPGGRIAIVSVGTPGEVAFNSSTQSPELDGRAFERLGRIELSQQAFLDTRGVGGGTVLIRGGRLLVDASSVLADNLGDVDGIGLGVDVDITGGAVIRNQSFVRADGFGAGRARDLRIKAESLEMDSVSAILSRSFASGAGGTVTVIATDAVSLEGIIFGASQPGSTGNAGDIVVEANKVILTNEAQIVGGTFGSGNGGELKVTARDLILTDGGLIFGGTFGSGNGGPLKVTARETISLDGSPSAISASAQTGSTGSGGDVVLEAKNVTVTGGAQILSGTFGLGTGGAVKVTATETITLEGKSLVDGIPSGISAAAEPGSTGNAGVVVLEAKNVTVTGGAQIASDTFSPGAGGAVKVTTREKISLDGSSSGIFTAAQTGSTGSAGDVVLEAENVTVTGGAQILSDTFSLGTGGAVKVTARETISLEGSPSRISATAQPGTSGGAGEVVLEAKNVVVSNGAVIASATFAQGSGGTVEVRASESFQSTGAFAHGERLVPTGIFVAASDSGNAGNVIVEAKNVTLTGGAQINSATGGSGDGGNVQVTATDRITVDGAGIFEDSLVPSAITAGSRSQASTGNAGNIVIDAKDVTLSRGAQIDSGTFGAGNGGTVDVTATETISLDGVSTHNRRAVRSGLFVSNQAGSTGNAGDIIVETKNVKITGGALIASETFGPGTGGAVGVTAAERISVGGDSAIASDTVGTGPGGRIDIGAAELHLQDGGAITSISRGAGPAGTIKVRATEAVTVSGSGSGLFTESRAEGRSGDIDVVAKHIGLTEGAQISAKSEGVGNAGNAGRLTLTATDMFRSRNSSVTTEAATADGGDIDLSVGSLLHLVDSKITTSVGIGQGRGGNITVDPRFVVLDHSEIRANAFGGPGGNISITADEFLTAESVVSASSALGVPGAIAIQANLTDVSGTLTQLPAGVLQAATLLRASCAARVATGKASSLVVVGREGLPPEPEGLLWSPLLAESTADLRLSANNRPHGEPLPRTWLTLLNPRCSR